MRKKDPSWQKKEIRSLSAVTSGVATRKSFLLLVECTMRPPLDNALAILSASSSRLFYQLPTTKNTKKNGLIKITTKTPYKGFNFNWKTPDVDMSPQKHQTRC